MTPRRDKGSGRNPAVGRIPAAPPQQPLQPTSPLLSAAPPLAPPPLSTPPLSARPLAPPQPRQPDPGKRARLTRATPDRPVVIPRRPGPTRDRPSAWHLLLLVPILIPLATPLYNRIEPRLFDMPFFYWGQIASVVFAMTVTAFVFQITKRRF